MRELLHVLTGLRCVALVGFLFALSGCGGGQSTLDTKAFGNGAKEIAARTSPPAPKLANGDKLKVTVFNEEKLSGDFVVDGAGNIAFPLIGQVVVGGLSGNEVEQRLTQRLTGRYLVNPKVSVEVISHRPFYMLGEVSKAGEYPYRAGLNVVSAIALAGGFTARASTGYVYIRRASGGGAQRLPIDPTVAVYPGDMITVQERIF
jgi:protein involved in polysaccharide export with SLBB domain